MIYLPDEKSVDCFVVAAGLVVPDWRAIDPPNYVAMVSSMLTIACQAGDKTYSRFSRSLCSGTIVTR